MVITLTVRPITPAEALRSGRRIPDEIIESFNDLIFQKIETDGIAKILENDVIELAIKKNLLLKREDFFEKGWLDDIEGYYNESGWQVKYNKPARDESFEPHFVFTSNYGSKRD